MQGNRLIVKNKKVFDRLATCIHRFLATVGYDVKGLFELPVTVRYDVVTTCENGTEIAHIMGVIFRAGVTYL